MSAEEVTLDQPEPMSFRRRASLYRRTEA